jgi:four helix bundle protein
MGRKFNQRFEDNVVMKLTFEFSSKIILYAKTLEADKRFIMVNPLIKSGTSIGANCCEIQNAESKQDFMHKIKIAAKEADETYYWLLLCKFAPNYPNTSELLSDIESIKKVLYKIIASLNSQYH